MKFDEEDRFTDEWLDAALESYNAEPQLGLETRILANLRAHQQPSRSLWVFSWRVLAVAAAIAMLAVGVAVWQQGRRIGFAKLASTSNEKIGATLSQTSRPNASEGAAEGPTDARVTQKNLERGAQRHSLLRIHTGRESTSKRRVQRPQREQFPSAAPLSAEERRLLEYVRSTPPKELALVAQLQEERQKNAEIEAEHDFQEWKK
jgi:hypothetical protein